jgi:hypothetical protein
MNLEEYINKYPEAKKRFEFNLQIKSKIRHELINNFEDFDKSSKKLLLALKKEVFNNNEIYVSGSRILGTYLTDVEYEKYSKIYPNVKKSDWDIKSLYKPDREKLKLFETEYNVKIDFQLGNSTIKV